MDKPTRNELVVTDRVFSGHLTGIPGIKPNKVLVYLSAGLSDMQAERNWIMKTGVPTLRTFCREHGLEFQLVDMKWGIREEETDKHSTIALCLQEIQHCQAVSVGPNFVALLGDKYGYRPLVAEIEATEFKLLKNTAIEHGYDISLLTTWYICDHNREPTTYVLQPISSQLPSYFDFSPLNTVLQQQAQKEWWAVVEKLQKMLRNVANILYQNGKITIAAKQKYFQSVLEAEVSAGIIGAGDARLKTICFQRTLNEINIKKSVNTAGRFTDLCDKVLDYEAEKLREQLRLEKVRSVMPRQNLYRYNLQWDTHGVDVWGNPQHKSYLEVFANDFLTSMKDMIKAGIAEVSSIYGNSPLLEEVLHHLHLCKTLCQTFCGRETTLIHIRAKLELAQQPDRSETQGRDVPLTANSMINGTDREEDIILMSDPFEWQTIPYDSETKSFDTDLSIDADSQTTKTRPSSVNALLDQTDIPPESGGDKNDTDIGSDHENDPLHKMISQAKVYSTPLVIYGRSGNGQTAVSAKIMESAKLWFPGCTSVVRFIGTSHISSSIRELILSICWQISHVYDIQGPGSVDLHVDFQTLTNYFRTLLWKIKTDSKPLVIILDSVDQLSTSDHAHEFHWLPQKLPCNVHLIVSVVSDRLTCLKQLRSIYSEHDRYVEITRLEQNDAADMISTICQKAGRHLVKKQRNILLDKFEQCGQTLYLKTLLNRAIYWRNTDDIKKGDIGANESEVLHKLFDKLETEHSSVMVKQCVSYLCASRGGLTDIEMEDLLSLDNEVLQDTYVYHLPLDPDIVRVPTFIWKSLWSDLQSYLIETKSGSHRVKNWFHRLAKEIATDRYLVAGNVKKVHENMADYFQGVWSSKPKPLNLTKGRKANYPYAHRQVPTQPTTFSANVYNTRMLHCLSYHLIHSGRFETLFTTLLTDPEWLYAKCLTLTMTSLLDDLRLTEAKLAEHIHSLREAVKCLEEDLMPSSKKKDELRKTKEQLSKHTELFEELKFLTKMVLQSSESVRRDPMYLPIQIIAQLGPSFTGLVHIGKLLERCVTWCSGTQMPLLLPLTECLEKPETQLLYTIGPKHPVTEDEKLQQEESILCLQEDTNRLYVVHHHSHKADEICIYDLKDFGSCVTILDLHTHIQSMKFTSNHRYILTKESQDRDSSVDFRLYRNLHSTSMTLPHPAYVLTTSKSGRFLAYAAGNDVHVCFCKRTFPAFHSFEDHSQPIACLHITPDDTLLVVIEQESSESHSSPRSLVFDLESKTMVHELDSKLSVTTDSLISNENILICNDASDLGKLCFLDLKNNVMLKEVQMTEMLLIRSLQLHQSHQYVLCGLENHGLVIQDNNCTGEGRSVVKLIKLSDGTMHGQCAFTYPFSCLRVFGTNHIYYAVSGVKETIVSIYYAGEVHNPLQRGCLVHRIQGHSGPVRTLIIPSKLDTIITASDDNTIKVWDLQLTLKSFHSDLSFIEKRLSSASRLEPTLEQIVSEYKYVDTSKRYRTTRLCFNKYGDSLYVGTDDGRLLRYCTDTGHLKMTRSTNIGHVNILFLSSSGQFVIAVGCQVHLEDLQADRQVILEPHSKVSSAVEANSILVCASMGPESMARVWNIKTGQVLCEISRPNTFQHIVINSTGTKITTLSNGRPIVFTLNGITAQQTGGVSDDNCYGEASCCCISQDDSRVAFGNEDGVVRMVDVKGETVHDLQQGSKVMTLTFTPDCKSLVTGGYKSIHVWSCRTGHQRYKLSRHTDFVTHLQFDKTGRFFVSFSQENQLILWDFHKSVSLATFYTQSGILGLDVANRTGAIAYVPEGLMDVAILKPNAVLRDVMNGCHTTARLESKVTALASAFSNQRSVQSEACVVM